MRRAFFLAFLAFQLAGFAYCCYQMASEPTDSRPHMVSGSGHYELMTGEYTPTDDDLGIPE